MWQEELRGQHHSTQPPSPILSHRIIHFLQSVLRVAEKGWMGLGWFQSLKQFFINVSYILVASLTLLALSKTEPTELDWLQVYGMTH